MAVHSDVSRLEVHFHKRKLEGLYRSVSEDYSIFITNAARNGDGPFDEHTEISPLDRKEHASSGR